MKKFLTGLALLAATATAMAQSNVTVYGTADAGVAYSTADRTDGVNKKAGVQGGMLQFNKIGFKGTEALGDGLKAIFQIEMGYDLGQGTGLNTARESFVGLGGSFGTVKLGRLETLDSQAAANFDALSASAFSPLGTAIGRETFSNSTVAYETKLGDVQLGAQYAFDGSSASANTTFGNGTPQERAASVSAVYGRGPLEVGYVYSNISNYGRVSADDRRIHVLGTSYDFQVAKVYGAYVNAKSDLANTLDAQVYALGVKVPVAKATVIDTSIAHVSDDVSNGHANIFGVQAVHSLSKRTAAYAGYQYVRNNGTQYAALNTNGVASQGTNGLNSSGLGVGLRHNF